MWSETSQEEGTDLLYKALHGDEESLCICCAVCLWCCRLHDCCYDRLSNNGCNAITDMYSYFYLSKTIYCGLGSWCETQSCECDKKFVHCLKRHLGSYNKKYRFYRKRRCGTEKLSCSKFAEMLSLPNINVFAQGKSNKM
ncbi:group IID secretory phospholipase A2-like isoform X3 [Emydura macquarii macquarii]|uniref:group IID secretory phospholipase A2-like isoform X3 n=1 Tax=Emydura macquarii macquarii TaxID=1129001 RepID=UPI003529FE3A